MTPTDLARPIATKILLAFAAAVCGLISIGADRLAANAKNEAVFGYNRPYQDENPKTFIKALELRQKLLEEFHSKDSLSDLEKIPLVLRMIELEKKTIAALKASDAAFVSGSAEPPEQLLEFARSGTISNAFYLAGLYRNTKQFSKSVETLEYAILNCRESYGDDHWKTKNYELHLATAKWTTAATDDQIAQYQNAVAASVRGTELFKAQNYAGAIDKYSMSEKAIENLGLAKSLIYGEVIANKAEAIAMSGDLEKAELAFEVAIQTNDSLLGKFAPTRASIRRSFAELLRQKGKFEKAMGVLVQEAEILAGTHGEISLPVAENRYVQGAFSQRAKQYQIASEHYFATLNLLGKLEQQFSQLALNTFGNLHDLFETVNQTSDAASSALSASKIAGGLYGANSPTVSDWLLISSKGFRQAGKTKEAIDVLMQAKAIYEKAEDYPKIKNYHTCLTALGTLQYSAGETEMGIKLLREAVSLTGKFQGQDSMAYFVAAQNLAVELSKSESRDEAEKIFEDLMPSLEKKLGENDIEYQRVINDRAENLFQNGKLDAALAQWKRLRSLKESSGLQASDEYRQILNRLVEIYIKTKNESAATEIREVLTSLPVGKDKTVTPVPGSGK